MQGLRYEAFERVRFVASNAYPCCFCHRRPLAGQPFSEPIPSLPPEPEGQNIKRSTGRSTAEAVPVDFAGSFQEGTPGRWAALCAFSGPSALLGPRQSQAFSNDFLISVVLGTGL